MRNCDKLKATLLFLEKFFARASDMLFNRNRNSGGVARRTFNLPETFPLPRCRDSGVGELVKREIIHSDIQKIVVHKAKNRNRTSA